MSKKKLELFEWHTCKVELRIGFCLFVSRRVVRLKRQSALSVVDEKQLDTDIEGIRFHTMVGRQCNECREFFFLCSAADNGDDFTNINYRMHVDLLIF